MAELSESGKQRLQALTAGYRDGLRAKADAIREAFEQFQASPQDPERISHLKTLVHRLAGSAATYGFVEVGSVAKTMDVLLLDHEDGSTAVNSAAIRELNESLELLMAAMSIACKSE